MQAFFTGNDYRGYRGAFCVPWTYNTHTFKRRTSTSKLIYIYIYSQHSYNIFSKYHADAAICLPFQMFFRLLKRILLITQVLVKADSTNRYLVYIFTQCLVTHLQTCPSCVLCVPQSFQGIQGNVRFLIPPQKNCEFHAG